MSAFFMPGAVELVMILLFGGGLGLPLGIPPQPEDPLLARVAPQECLFYTSWAGMSEPDPNSPNQTEQLLAEPEVQHVITQVERLVRTGLRQQMLEEEGPEAAALADDAIRWGKVLLVHPAAAFVSNVEITPDGPHIHAGAVVNVGQDAAELKATLEKHQERFLRGAAQTVQIGDDSWYRFTPGRRAPPITWGVKDGYFIVGVGEEAVQRMLERADGGTTETVVPPEWFSKINQQLPVERRATVTYINVKAISGTLVPLAGGPRARKALDALGLGNVTSLISVTGLDQTGFVSKALVGLDGEPQGLLSLAAGQPLDCEDLAPIPHDSSIAMAARVNGERVLETVLSVAGKIDPDAREEILEGLGEMQEELGIDLKGDLLQTLGDTWCVYNSPSEGGLVITGLTAVVEVKDRSKLAATHANFVARMREDLSRHRRGPRIDEFQFAGHKVYVFNARDDDFPLAPSWCLTEDALVIAAFPQNIKAYLSRGDDQRSIAEVAEVAGLFQSGPGPIMLSYVDTRSLFELFYPFVPMVAQAGLSELAREGIDASVSILPSAKAIGPHLRPGVGALRRTDAGIEIVSRQTLPGGNLGSSAPVAVAMLLPAVQAAREAARRTQSTNNMKQIGIALLNYHDVHKSFPAAYSTDEDGKPLLSWRVHVLPYIEQQPLYKQFHLDEPWDSEHNKKLIPMMPPTLRSPNSEAGPGKTNYLGVGGERGVFPGKDPIRISEITDGTSNTIAVVEASDQSAVVWTKPEDFQPDLKDPFRGLLGLRPGGFIAAFCDGSTRFISESVDEGLLQALLTRNGGEPVDSGNLDAARRRRTPYPVATTPPRVARPPLPARPAPPLPPAPATPGRERPAADVSAPAVEAAASNRYDVPEGGVDELLKFIEDLKKFRPKTREQYTEHRGKAPPALKAAAERILKLEKDESSQAFQTALLVLLQDRVRTISSASPGEQRNTVAHVKTFLTAKSEKGLEPQDVSLAMSAARALEYTGNHQLAADAYGSFAELIAKSKDEKLSEMAKMMEGAARRLTLLGKEIKIEGSTMDGTPFDWAAYRGKVVLIDFWTTWCPFCWPEIANGKKNYALYHDRGFDVVGINLDEDTEKVKKYVEKENIPWVILHKEGAGWAHPTATYYGVSSVPTMLLVDREGKVVSLRARGQELGKLLENLIGPPYAPKGKLTHIDLQAKANAKLTEDLSDSKGNNLAELPIGEHTLGNVKFKIADALIQLAGKQTPNRPQKIEKIPVGQSLKTLYILHGTQYGTSPYLVKDGTLIGQYLVHYEDKTSETIPIVYGEDVRNWWNADDSRAVTRGRVVWTGSNAAAGRFNRSLRLYLTAWENPYPDKKITGVDYVSTNTTDAAPFCVAMTVEQPASAASDK